MAFISLGRIEKKLILLLGSIIIQIIFLIVSIKTPENLTKYFLSDLLDIFGQITFGVIIHFKFKNTKRGNIIKKRFIYIIILFFLRSITACFINLFSYFVTEDKYKMFNISNSINGLEIIIVTLGTSIILKYKYYIHHMITMLLFSVLGFIIDLILGSYNIMNFTYIYIFLIYVIVDVFILIYMKYMMDNLFFGYAEIMIYCGIIALIDIICIDAALAVYEDKNNIYGTYNLIFDEIAAYFRETKVEIIIFYQFLYFIVIGGLDLLFEILILYYLKPNYILIVLVFSEFEDVIFNSDNPNKLYTLIPFALQFLDLLFYFEILELNFWKLNKNTVKNIRKREKLLDINEDDNNVSRESVQNRIELVDQYYLVNEEQKGNDNDNNNNKD